MDGAMAHRSKKKYESIRCSQHHFIIYEAITTPLLHDYSGHHIASSAVAPPLHHLYSGHHTASSAVTSPLHHHYSGGGKNSWSELLCLCQYSAVYTSRKTE